MPKHREVRKVAGVEIAEKLRKLKGRSEARLADDRVRGAASPLTASKRMEKRGRGK
jgi:hypothetical protein